MFSSCMALKYSANDLIFSKKTDKNKQKIAS